MRRFKALRQLINLRGLALSAVGVLLQIRRLGLQLLIGIFKLRVSPIKLRFEVLCCFARSAQLAHQARVILVELGQVALLDGDCLV